MGHRSTHVPHPMQSSAFILAIYDVRDFIGDPRETATRMLSERGHNPMESFKNNYWR